MINEHQILEFFDNHSFFKVAKSKLEVLFEIEKYSDGNLKTLL